MAHEPLYTIGEVLSRTGLNRATVNRYIESYHIDCAHSDKDVSGQSRTRGARIPRRLSEENVRQLELVAALSQDVVFYKAEIISILKNMSADEFADLFQRCSFLELLRHLRKRKVVIAETKLLDQFLKDRHNQK